MSPAINVCGLAILLCRSGFLKFFLPVVHEHIGIAPPIYSAGSTGKDNETLNNAA